MATVASIKVCDPVAVPLSVLEELQQLRVHLEQLRRENERLRLENQRLQADLDQAKTDLHAANRAGKRQAAPFSKGPPKAQPKPGRQRGAAHGRHGHRPAPPPDRIDQTLEAPLPDACPACGDGIAPTEVATQFQTEIPRRPLVRLFNIHVGCCRACGQAEICQEIKASACLTPDETGWRVAGQPAWLHAYAVRGRNLVSVHDGTLPPQVSACQGE